MTIKHLFLSTAIGVATSCFTSLEARAGEPPAEASPEGFQPVKSEIINNAPEKFTIDVDFLQNAFVNREAPTFAFYVTKKTPTTCADFRGQQYRTTQPSDYTYRFNLKADDPLISSVSSYGCVIFNKSDLVL